MQSEEIADWRERAQRALSKARLVADPAMKAHWKALAEEYLARLAELQADEPQPKVSRVG